MDLVADRSWRRHLLPHALWLIVPGAVVLLALAFVSAGWTLLAVALLVITIRTWRAPGWRLSGDGASRRFHLGARRSLLLTDVAAIFEQFVPAAAPRGIRTTRDVTVWRIADRSGRTIAVTNTVGLDPADVARFRAAIDVPFVPLERALAQGIAPIDLPWHVRHPGASVMLAAVASLAVIVAVIAMPPYWG